MRVNVDSKAFVDARFKRLGARLRMNWFEALGRCLPVWALAYENRSAIMSRLDIDGSSETADFTAAMIAVDLAVEQSSGEIYLRGVTERVEYLLLQDAKRALAAAAKRAKLGLSPGPSPGTSPGKNGVTIPRDRPPGRPPGTEPSIDASPGTSPGTPRIRVSGVPYSPDQDLDPDLVPRAAAAVPREEPDPTRLPFETKTSGRTPEESARYDLAQKAWRRLAALRARLIAELGISAMPMEDVAIAEQRPEGEFRELLRRIRELGSTREAITRIQHAFDWAEHDAREDHDAIRWVDGVLFTLKTWNNFQRRAAPPKKHIATVVDWQPKEPTEAERAAAARARIAELDRLDAEDEARRKDPTRVRVTPANIRIRGGAKA
jgi:hypothetical protein